MKTRSLPLSFIAWFGSLLIWSFSAFAQNLNSELVIVHGNENYPPFEMMSGDSFAGLHADIVNAAATRIGVKVKWVAVPWKRALAMVESGEADAITYISKSPERETWAFFLENNLLSSAKISFIVLKENPKKISYNGNLAKFLQDVDAPIVMRGFSVGNDLIDRGKKQEAGTMGQLVSMLLAKRADVAIVNWSDFSGAFKDRPELNSVVPLSPPVAENKNYIAFSKARKHESVARRFGDSIKAFKETPAYLGLLAHYKVTN